MIECPLEEKSPGRWVCPREGCGAVLPVFARRACDNQTSRGLGDTVAKMTSAVGIKPCGGCKKRQAALNRVVPYSPDKD